jgi:hypothetical protein
MIREHASVAGAPGGAAGVSGAIAPDLEVGEAGGSLAPASERAEGAAAGAALVAKEVG